MARLQGIGGGLSGKMGAVVFRQRGGETIATQYQPQVKNPNTDGQQTARAKFKLMAQLAAIMAPGFGTLGVTKRGGHAKPSQRNGFTQLNYPLIEVTSDNQEVTAKIPMEQLKLTSSFRPLPELQLAATTGGIDLDIIGISTDVSAVRLVVVGYNNNVATIIRMMDTPVGSDNPNVSISIEDLPKGKYTVLAYGLIPSEEAKTSIDLDNIHTPEDEDFISAIELNTMVANGLMAETMTRGANVEVVAI